MGNMDSGNIMLTIASARKNAGLTQSELAEKVGVSTYTMSMYENGKFDPKLSIARKISEEVKIPLDNLIFAPMKSN